MKENSEETDHEWDKGKGDDDDKNTSNTFKRLRGCRIHKQK